jgi:hypothetical protein
MNEDRIGKCLRQVEHSYGHLWHRFSIAVNQVMVTTVKPCYSIFSFVCMFCRSLIVLLYFLFWSLCCIFFFNLRISITPLVFSSSTVKLSKWWLQLGVNWQSNRQCTATQHRKLQIIVINCARCVIILVYLCLKVNTTPPPKNIIILPLQLVPANPLPHWQTYVWSVRSGIHVPAFWHGLRLQIAGA